MISENQTNSKWKKWKGRKNWWTLCKYLLKENEKNETNWWWNDFWN